MHDIIEQMVKKVCDVFIAAVQFQREKCMLL